MPSWFCLAAHQICTSKYTKALKNSRFFNVVHLQRTCWGQTQNCSIRTGSYSMWFIIRLSITTCLPCLILMFPARMLPPLKSKCRILGIVVCWWVKRPSIPSITECSLKESLRMLIEILRETLSLKLTWRCKSKPENLLGCKHGQIIVSFSTRNMKNKNEILLFAPSLNLL